jgi:hypothetical protein
MHLDGVYIAKSLVISYGTGIQWKCVSYPHIIHPLCTGAPGVHSGWALWLQCNQNTAFRKLLVSSEELSWFLVWFFFWFRGGWRKSLQVLHIGGNPELDLEQEQDSGTKLIMLELWINQIAATNTGCKVQTCFLLQVWMFFQQELGRNLEVIRVIHKVTLSLGLLFTPYPFFQWSLQSKEILLNLSMKCSPYNAQGSRVIIVVV